MNTLQQQAMDRVGENAEPVFGLGEPSGPAPDIFEAMGMTPVGAGQLSILKEPNAMRTNSQGETISAHDQGEDLPRMGGETSSISGGGDRVPLAASRAKRAYIAGPMTGYPEFNFPAFNAKAAELRAQGWHIENPAEHGIVDGATWADYLHYDITRLATCEAMHLLPGWSASKGAKLEVSIAQSLGMAIHFADGAEPLTPTSEAAP